MREQRRGQVVGVGWAVLCVLFLSACEEEGALEGSVTSEDGGTAFPPPFGLGAATPPIVTPAIIITPQPAVPDAGEPDASEPAPDASGPDAELPVGDCGNGVIDDDEVCDPGAQACCNTRCDGAASTSALCRNDVGPCDVQERCDGESFECPDDEFEDEGVVCRAAADLCDRAEECTGDSGECPANDARLGELDACNGGLGRCMSEVCCPGATVNLGDGTCGSALDARLAFVTALDHDGAIGGLAAADARCNAAAADANLNGTYHAWLSTPGIVGGPPPVHAVERVTYDALALVDGTLVTTSLDDLLSNDPIAPISRTAWNEARDVAVWTGTNGRGSASTNACSGWTSSDAAGMGMIGDSGAIVGWTDGAALTCEQPAALYCFQDDCPGKGHVDYTTDNQHCGECGNACAPELTCIAGQCAARVFVSSAVTPGAIDVTGIGALPAADTICNNYAMDAMLSGTYRAWLSTTTVDAASRIVDAPYFRTDGVQVAASRAQLLSSLATPLMAPIDRNERAGQVGAGTPVWTGTTASGELSTDAHCSNWTGAGGRIDDGTYGIATATDGTWTSADTVLCSGSASLYCFQVSRTPLRGADAVVVDGL